MLYRPYCWGLRTFLEVPQTPVKRVIASQSEGEDDAREEMEEAHGRVVQPVLLGFAPVLSAHMC